MKNIIVCILILFLVGCGTTGVVYEFDKDGKVTKQTEFSKGAVAELMDEMKDKNIARWKKGWGVTFECTLLGETTYVPTFCLRVFRLTSGWVSFKDSSEHVPATVEMINQNMNIDASKDGITISED